MFKGKSKLIYDPYVFTDRDNSSFLPSVVSESLKIGVIGRITKSKGIETFVKVAEWLEANNKEADFLFCLYGDFSEDVINTPVQERLSRLRNVRLMAFVEDKKAIYQNIHCVLHCNQAEPLGRIFLESIDVGIPCVGFDEGGIGELGHLLGLEGFLVKASIDNIEVDIVDMLYKVKNSYQVSVEMVRSKRDIARKVFSIEKYVTVLDGMVVS
jgi:glycosyltransferase involved in cell wall biosynthesis